MEKFASLLTRPAEVGKESENNDIKGTVIGTIGTIAHVSKEVCFQVYWV
jgi:hypothetical protein